MNNQFVAILKLKEINQKPDTSRDLSKRNKENGQRTIFTLSSSLHLFLWFLSLCLSNTLSANYDTLLRVAFLCSLHILISNANNRLWQVLIIWTVVSFLPLEPTLIHSTWFNESSERHNVKKNKRQGDPKKEGYDSIYCKKWFNLPLSRQLQSFSLTRLTSKKIKLRQKI